MDLKALQVPLKQSYQRDPERARVLLAATGSVDVESVTCRITSSRGLQTAGLHPAVGGVEGFACSGELLLESLVACFGVTLAAVATAMRLPVRGAEVRVQGVWDARGTLGVSREAPVGFGAIDLEVAVDSPAARADLDRLVELTERYCVVLQTLKHTPELSARVRLG